MQHLGVTVKNSFDLLMVIRLISPDASRDQLYLSNYATLHVKDALIRMPGVADAQVFGGMTTRCASRPDPDPDPDPDRVAAHDMIAGEVVAALQA